jgi:hypothetical protein
MQKTGIGLKTVLAGILLLSLLLAFGSMANLDRWEWIVAGIFSIALLIGIPLLLKSEKA